MHEKYDFDSIPCSVKKTISISMIVTSVYFAFLLHTEAAQTVAGFNMAYM